MGNFSFIGPINTSLTLSQMDEQIIGRNVSLCIVQNDVSIQF